MWSVFCFGQEALEQQQLVIGKKALVVEVANTDEQRQKGLMGRHFLAENQGMLFVFDGAEIPCFWMKNTFIPLSLAFISSDARIVQIENLVPESQALVCARQPIKYALEVNQGWFIRNNVQLMTRIAGISLP